MLILFADSFDKTLPGILARYAEVTDDIGRLAEADVVLVRSKTKVNRQFIDSAPKLRLIIRGGVGMDTIDMEYAGEKGIAARNTAEASTTAVAELAFAMMIAMPNHLVAANHTTKEGKWLKNAYSRTELHSKTLAILGLGRIGLALAVRARGFQMHVIGYHPDVNFTDFAEIRNTLRDAVMNADYVSLHMPLTDDTRGMINARTLEMFKRGAYLINTSRGAIIQEQDVADALSTGRLAGYATDVFDPEPPAASPLFTAPNVLCTPHIGATTQENMLRIGMMIERIVGEFVSNAGRTLVR